MRSPRLAFAASILVSMLITSGVRAQLAAGTAFTFQGRLDNSSLPANGTFDLQFKLFDAAVAGAQQGSTICVDNLPVTGGLVTTTLDFGAVYPGGARWIEVAARPDATVGNCGGGAYTTLSPRQQMTPTPYAEGLALPVIQSQVVGGAGNAVMWLTNFSNDGGTYGIKGQANSNNSGAAGVFGFAQSGSAATYGVLGQSTSTSGEGVLGQHTAGTGVAPGVHGTTASTSSTAVGVLGEVLPTSAGGSSVGVYGFNHSTTGLGIGVQGTQNGAGWGVYGTVPSGIAVYGQATSSTGVNYGVFGQTSSPSGFAGYFDGALRTVGNFSALGTTTLTGAVQASSFVNVDGNITHPYTSGGTQQRCTPIAYGTVTAAGVFSNGSSNFTVSWDATNNWYLIAIPGESYHFLSDTTMVTPATSSPLFAATNSVSGQLIVQIYNLSGTRVQSAFSFAVFRP
jgi:hypothetical protein